MPQTVFASRSRCQKSTSCSTPSTPTPSGKSTTHALHARLRTRAKTPSRSRNIADAQHASLALLLRVKHETERRGSL